MSGLAPPPKSTPMQCVRACVCVCVCMRACVHACVCVCVRPAVSHVYPANLKDILYLVHWEDYLCVQLSARLCYITNNLRKLIHRTVVATQLELWQPL